MKRLVIIPALHAVILIAEVIAFIHDIQAFGIGMFQYYTINSNLLQMIVSACFLVYFLRKKDVPAVFEMLHLVSAVGLTITFLIAAFVLAPQEGFAYYFLSNVAPINHFFGPVLSVITFIFAVQRNPLRTGSIFAPMVFTLLYGVIALILNAVRVLDGPYFFLRVHKVPAGTIILWFGIITVMCLAFSGLYMYFRKLNRPRSAS
jgi:hypothetical protein